MTRDEIMAMDEDALNVAVMTALGYVQVETHEDDTIWALDVTPAGTVYVVKHYMQVPGKDYPHAIAAAYELEDALPEEKREQYWRHLRWVLQNKDVTDFGGWSLLHASAADRCRAWLMTM